MNLTDLLDLLSYWLVLARRAALKILLRLVEPNVHYEDGCCSCGALLATWVYWEATDGLGKPGEPDWSQCNTCEADPENEWFRSLRHMTVTQWRAEVEA